MALSMPLILRQAQYEAGGLGNPHPEPVEG